MRPTSISIPASRTRRLRFATAAVLSGLLSILLLMPASAAESGLPPIAQSGPEAQRYVLLQVLSPKQGETVHDNTGNVAVKVTVRPPLRSQDGHRLRAMLDGALLPGVWQTTRFTMQGVNRGTHTLRVVITDADARSLIESEPVEFSVWQASRLFPSRRSTH
jgi:hypothetical protein